MMLNFLKPVESLSDFIFISMLFERSKVRLPVFPRDGRPNTLFWNGLYSTSSTLPSGLVFWYVS